MIRTIEPEENDVPARREHTWVSRAGWVEVIAGSMFSGKSEELIRRLRRAKIARQKVQVFKPEIDSRFSESHIVSHSEMRHESSNVHSAAEIRALVQPETEVGGIDEAQFFDNELIAVANELAGRGMRVIVAGLDTDYTAKPWNRCRNYSRLPNTSPRRTAICMKCGQPSNYTKELKSESESPSAAPTCTKHAAVLALYPCRRPDSYEGYGNCGSPKWEDVLGSERWLLYLIVSGRQNISSSLVTLGGRLDFWAVRD